MVRHGMMRGLLWGVAAAAAASETASAAPGSWSPAHNGEGPEAAAAAVEGLQEPPALKVQPLESAGAAAPSGSGVPLEQAHFRAYMQSYLPPGDYEAYTAPYAGDKASWNGYMSQFGGSSANYSDFIAKYGGTKADYGTYVSLYSSMAGVNPSSGKDWSQKREQQLAAWNNSMTKTLDSYLSGPERQFAGGGMEARAGSGGGGTPGVSYKGYSKDYEGLGGGGSGHGQGPGEAPMGTPQRQQSPGSWGADGGTNSWAAQVPQSASWGTAGGGYWPGPSGDAVDQGPAGAQAPQAPQASWPGVPQGTGKAEGSVPGAPGTASAGGPASGGSLDAPQWGPPSEGAGPDTAPMWPDGESSGRHGAVSPEGAAPEAVQGDEGGFGGFGDYDKYLSQYAGIGRRPRLDDQPVAPDPLAHGHDVGPSPSGNEAVRSVDDSAGSYHSWLRQFSGYEGRNFASNQPGDSGFDYLGYMRAYAQQQPSWKEHAGPAEAASLAEPAATAAPVPKGLGDAATGRAAAVAAAVNRAPADGSNGITRGRPTVPRAPAVHAASKAARPLVVPRGGAAREAAGASRDRFEMAVNGATAVGEKVGQKAGAVTFLVASQEGSARRSPYATVVAAASAAASLAAVLFAWHSRQRPQPVAMPEIMLG